MLRHQLLIIITNYNHNADNVWRPYLRQTTITLQTMLETLPSSYLVGVNQLLQTTRRHCQLIRNLPGQTENRTNCNFTNNT